jgi:hypothetical protein
VNLYLCMFGGKPARLNAVLPSPRPTNEALSFGEYGDASSNKAFTSKLTRRPSSIPRLRKLYVIYMNLTSCTLQITSFKTLLTKSQGRLLAHYHQQSRRPSLSARLLYCPQQTFHKRLPCPSRHISWVPRPPYTLNAPISNSRTR